MPIIFITIASAIYQVIVGSFNEVPADIYAHMERYQEAVTFLSNNSLGGALPFRELLFQKSGVSYFLMAGIANITGASTEQVISVIDFANRTLFLLAIFFFTSSIFKGRQHNISIASMAVIFTALHMGVNVFAYIRYYTLAPTMLNMIVYMSAIILFLSLIAQRFKSTSWLLYGVLFFLIAAAASIHVQEAMFIGVMVAVISFLGMISCVRFIPIKSPHDFRQTIVISIVASIAFVSIYIYSHLNLPRAVNAHWRLWEFGAGVGLLPDLTTLNLKFQFSRVMTLWGIFVYLLFFVHIRRYRNNIFILAGMLSPAVTFLNPFFVDLFLRHYNSTTLWRLCYLIPVHFVAADLFIFYSQKLRENGFLKRSISLIVVLLMIALLLPIKNTWQGIHYSRFPTLGATNEKLGYAYYQDLLTFLESLDQPYEILTDPMTGYMVSAMTKHESKRRKFFRSHGHKRFSFYDYSNNPLIQYKGYLLIVNQRKKHLSNLGLIANHWSKNEWKNTDNYYPKELIEHLNENSNRFHKEWGKEGVSVFLVK